MTRKTSLMLGFAALFVVGAPAICQADSLPAMAGHTWTLSDAGCLSSSWSGVTNTCNRTVKVLIPAQSRATGTWKFYATRPKVSGIVIDGFPIKCRAVVTDNLNNLQGQTNLTSLGYNGATLLGSLTISSNSVVHFDCDVSTTAQLLSVSWSQ